MCNSSTYICISYTRVRVYVPVGPLDECLVVYGSHDNSRLCQVVEWYWTIDRWRDDGGIKGRSGHNHSRLSQSSQRWGQVTGERSTRKVKPMTRTNKISVGGVDVGCFSVEFGQIFMHLRLFEHERIHLREVDRNPAGAELRKNPKYANGCN